jgi:hypothetical protein
MVCDFPCILFTDGTFGIGGLQSVSELPFQIRDVPYRDFSARMPNYRRGANVPFGEQINQGNLERRACGLTDGRFVDARRLLITHKLHCWG